MKRIILIGLVLWVLHILAAVSSYHPADLLGLKNSTVERDITFSFFVISLFIFLIYINRGYIFGETKKENCAFGKRVFKFNHEGLIEKRYFINNFGFVIQEIEYYEEKAVSIKTYSDYNVLESIITMDENGNPVKVEQCRRNKSNPGVIVEWSSKGNLKSVL